MYSKHNQKASYDLRNYKQISKIYKNESKADSKQVDRTSKTYILQHILGKLKKNAKQFYFCEIKLSCLNIKLKFHIMIESFNKTHLKINKIKFLPILTNYVSNKIIKLN